MGWVMANGVKRDGMKRKWAAAGIAACALWLAACSGGSSGGAAASPSGASNPQDTGGAAPAPGTSPWTTLGTRAAPARADTPIAANAGAVWSDYDPPLTYSGMQTRATQFITMRDGVKLAAYVTLPTDASGDAVNGPLPTILIQTSYNGGAETYAGSIGSVLGAADPYLVEHGYAVVVVDVRGTGQSGGVWQAFGAEEQADYGEVVDWVQSQPWCDGNIGVYGVSYLGITAVITAAQDHPAVKAAFPIVPIGDGYRDIVFTGGQVNPTFIPFWLTLVTALSVTNPCALTDPATCGPTTLQHLSNALTQFQAPLVLKALLGDGTTAYDDPAPDSFWAIRSPLENDGKISVPTFIVGGLHDLFQRSEPLTYEAIKNQTTTKLLIGPWTHLEAGLGQGLPADGVPPLNHIALRWFDQYLKGLSVGADALPNVTQYVAGLGHYVTAVDWPHPQATAQRLYLHADKSLGEDVPAKNATPHIFVANPLEGLCSISASQWTAGILGFIPVPCFTNDNSANLWNVNYQTPVLDAGLYLNGPIEADVWISSSAQDASVSVRVDDVGPDGTAVALTNGLQTASLRAVDETRSRTLDGEMIQPWHPYTQASTQALVPGQPTLVRVEIFPTSAYLAPGHRLQVSIGASNVAQGLPPIPTLLGTLSLSTTLYDDADHPSSVVLPVVPTAALGNGVE